MDAVAPGRLPWRGLRVHRHQLESLGVALLVDAFGVALLLIAMLDSRDHAFPSGRGPVLAAGLVVLLIGLAASWAALRALTARSRWLGAAGALALALLLAPPAWIALARGVFPGRPPPAPAPAVRERIALSVDPATVFAGRVVRITFDRPLSVPEGYSPFICIVEPGAPSWHFGRWAYLARGATEARLVVPGAPGPYEVRLLPHMNHIMARLRIDARVPPDLPVERDDADADARRGALQPVER